MKSDLKIAIANSDKRENGKSAIDLIPLESGDRLTRHEFERRYEMMPHGKKAELIEGVVYMAAALRHRKHGKPHSLIMTWLGVYYAATPGVDLSDAATVRLDEDSEPQPDALLRIDVGGQSTVSDDDYLEGAPELVVEIAASSASYDLHDKLRIYRRHRVQEYLVWRTYQQRFDWLRLREGEYIALEPNADGIICSEIFPGLQLSVSALLAGNLAEVLVVLQQGLDTAEHQAFVEQLSSKGLG
ncbi:Uma2 family endonuclease [Microcoleus sp. herbarium8]|uniref:Uma2 family endonuclease n=1 Tax=Microcoleus sp. herbarium8 TaxID=3055436 RepID=UPI002FCFD7AB